MKKFLLILKGIIIAIRDWFAEEVLWYVRTFKSKRDKVNLSRAKVVCDNYTKQTGRIHFIFKDKELGTFIKFNWPVKYGDHIIGQYVVMCRRDYDFFSRQTVSVNGRRTRALKKLGLVGIDKLIIYKSK